MIVFGILEAATAGLVSFWFVCGSVAALLAAFLGAALWLQVVLFLSVSAITLAATRPLVRKMSAKAVPTNLDRAIGSAARVTEEIDNDAGTGAVYVDGKTWSARSSDGSPIPIGRQGRCGPYGGRKALCHAGAVCLRAVTRRKYGKRDVLTDVPSFGLLIRSC